MTELRWELENVVVGPPSTNMTNSASNGKSIKTEVVRSDDFPTGLRVLVVDDDPVYLLLLDRMLRQCRYLATTRSNALSALKLLRENKDNFDLVISDVHMPDMDGFKLLELVGLEMDLPVIMMSANGETSTVMKGIIHGACDYMLKPVRLEELRNIWQHVVRKKNKGVEQVCIHEEGRHSHFIDDGNTVSSHLKRKGAANNKAEEDEEDDDGDQDNVEPLSSKRPRVVWSMDLHQQFVNAVNQLGIDKAVPKRILELMNVQGLSRENVASHLQKYRLYLKRLNVNHSGRGPMVAGSSFIGVSDSNMGIVMAGRRVGLGEMLHNPLADARLSQQASISPFQGGLLGSNHGSLMKSLFVVPSIQTQASSVSRASSDLNALVQGRLLSQGSSNSQCSFVASTIGLDNNSNLSGSLNNDALLAQMLHRRANAWTRGNSGISGFTSNCILRPNEPLRDVESGGILRINEEVGSRHLSPLLVSNSGPLLDCFGQINNNGPTGCQIDMPSIGEEALVEQSFLSDVYESIPRIVSADGRGSYKPSFLSTPCHNGQWTGHKGNKESLDVSASQLGNPYASLVEPFQSSDDFLNVISNQQHGGMGFTDNDLAIDGFRLNDTYVV